MSDLFTEMDHAADLLRANNPELGASLSDELQLEFRQLQKQRMPWLSKEEFLDLFHTWRDHYIAKLEAELVEIRKRRVANDIKPDALIAERNRRNPAANQFICKCGDRRSVRPRADAYPPAALHCRIAGTRSRRADALARTCATNDGGWQQY